MPASLKRVASKGENLRLFAGEEIVEEMDFLYPLLQRLFHLVKDALHAFAAVFLPRAAQMRHRTIGTAQHAASRCHDIAIAGRFFRIADLAPFQHPGISIPVIGIQQLREHKIDLATDGIIADPRGHGPPGLVGRLRPGQNGNDIRPNAADSSRRRSR